MKVPSLRVTGFTILEKMCANKDVPAGEETQVSARVQRSFHRSPLTVSSNNQGRLKVCSGDVLPISGPVERSDHSCGDPPTK